MKNIKFIIAVAVLGLLSFTCLQKGKPVLYIIGDSTVKNGSGKGADQLWGWGSFINEYFDTTRMDVQNHAIGGRSSRTFITDGRWDKIVMSLKKGDFVIMQFGHNDSGPLDDTARARGTIKGIGNDSIEIYNPIRKVKETVHTYGWYMQKYIKETQAKGAVAIVCSPVPRNNFKEGKASRSTLDYGLWARQSAESAGAYFIELNGIIADKYDSLGAESVARFFPKDNTHPNQEGSRMNAGLVIESIQKLKQCKLKEYLK